MPSGTFITPEILSPSPRKLTRYRRYAPKSPIRRPSFRLCPSYFFWISASMEIGCGGFDFLVGRVVGVGVGPEVVVGANGVGLFEVATGLGDGGADAGLVQPPSARASNTTNDEGSLICRVFPGYYYSSAGDGPWVCPASGTAEMNPADRVSGEHPRGRRRRAGSG